MLNFTLRKKVLLIVSLLSFIVLGLIFYSIVNLERSAEDIVEGSKQITESAIDRLRDAGIPTIDSLVLNPTFMHSSESRLEMKRIDSLLAAISTSALVSFNGMEGGFYFPQIDEFFGYSFPTSPEPKPAYGPPPRSYKIIHNQILKSCREKRRITAIHQFDPAKFPLVTEPIEQNGKVIGAVWTRVHIERLIPQFSLIDILLSAAIILLLGFAVALYITWTMRKRVEELRIGLQLLHTDGTFRYEPKRGVFGEIANSINEMIEARVLEQERRIKLENDLHQKDKMVTLGTLIAGVAHEVKTPLAVIKTRIQMWERKLEQLNSAPEQGKVVTPEAMELVIREIDRLSDLVKRLLVFSKPVANKFRLTDMNELLTRTLFLLQNDSDNHHITIDLKLENNLPLLNIDPQAMEQVFLNIITNSYEAMGTQGTLQIRTSHDRVEGVAIIEIEDSGAGIQEESMSKIFNPFFTTKVNGVGLGLSISNEIVRAHRGSIEFPRSDASGTLCRITLPLSLQL